MVSSIYQDVLGIIIVIVIFLLLYAQREKKSILDVVKEVMERFR